MSDARAWSYRAGFGLALGTAAGIVLYVAYKERWRERLRNQTFTDDENVCNQHSTPLRHGFRDSPLQQYQGPFERPLEAGDAHIFSSNSVPIEDPEILHRLDYIYQSITELRHEVSELRNSLQGLATDIIGQFKSHITESQKASRRRRFVFHRERSDSTGSSSVYFTATSGTAQTDRESEGGPSEWTLVISINFTSTRYTTANPESDYDRESGRESDEDDESCETVKTVRRDSMDLMNEEEATLTFDSLEEEELLQHIVREKCEDEAKDGSEGSKQHLNQNYYSTDFVVNGQLEGNPGEFEH
ncbi:regulator of microtubule dynamics protein 3 isoform X1 [Pleurodeles waltl]|uniref:regulator of microtubule dynamics protein 3 isoform X1 n=1 Tax=Pleurodeles waltl TaxID=8319 RepID=UPI0037097EF3